MKIFRYVLLGLVFWAGLGPRVWAADIDLGDLFVVGSYLRNGSPIALVSARRVGNQGPGVLQFRINNEVARTCLNAAHTARLTGDVLRFRIPSLPSNPETFYTATYCAVFRIGTGE